MDERRAQMSREISAEYRRVLDKSSISGEGKDYIQMIYVIRVL